jgi:hypothetical protein
MKYKDSKETSYSTDRSFFSMSRIVCDVSTESYILLQVRNFFIFIMLIHLNFQVETI